MSVIDYNFPFAVAFALLVLIAAAQLIGLGDLIGDADGDVDAHHAGPLDGLVSFLGIGRLPFLVWLALLLLMFSGVGTTVQFLLDASTGQMLPPTLAAAAAALPALLLTALVSRAVSPLMPRDETTAIPVSALLGKRGTVDIGVSRRGHPARAIVRDTHGQPHNVMVEPHEDGAEFSAGDEVLLVRLDADIFYAIPTSDRRLGPVA